MYLYPSSFVLNQKMRWLLVRVRDEIGLFGYDADELQQHGLTEMREGTRFRCDQDEQEDEREIIKILDGKLAEDLQYLADFDYYFCNGEILDILSRLLYTVQEVMR